MIKKLAGIFAVALLVLTGLGFSVPKEAQALTNTVCQSRSSTESRNLRFASGTNGSGSRFSVAEGACQRRDVDSVYVPAGCHVVLNGQYVRYGANGGYWWNRSSNWNSVYSNKFQISRCN